MRTAVDFQAWAFQQDAADPISRFRDQFIIDDPEMVYMDGNSLGRLPLNTKSAVDNIVNHQWGNRLIQSWPEAWFESPHRIGRKIAGLVGACPEEVIVSDSTSVNLYKTAMAALGMNNQRKKIITDEFNFPSDLYILQGCCQQINKGHSIQTIMSKDGISIDSKDIESELNEDIALVTLSHVVFKSGYLYDAQRVTEMAHKAGALVLWDLSHSVGSVPIELNQWNADFAIGCTYKYLNGGPGAPAFLYVRKDLINSSMSPIWGWFGDANPFAFSLDYSPSNHIKRFLVGTPPILSLLGMEPGVDLSLEAGMDRIREKSIQQTTFMIELFDQILAPLGFTLGTPRDPSLRGSHVSIKHPEGYRIARSLIDDYKVIPDFREPDNIRLGIAPIYTRFIDIWEAVDRIRKLMQDGRFLHYSPERLAVT